MGPRGTSASTPQHTLLRGLLVIAAGCLALGAFASACGDQSGPLTVQQYFQEVQRIQRDADLQSQKVLSNYNSNLTSGETQEDAIGAFQHFVRAMQRTATSAESDLNDIDPPARVRVEHRGLISARHEMSRLVKSYADRAQGIETPEQLQTASGEFQAEAGPILDRVGQACTSLEGVAKQESIDVDLHCVP